MNPKIRFWTAVFTLFGTIVGAGIFALPYTIVKAGLWPSLFFFALITISAVLLHLMYGEVVLRTIGAHRLPGYAQLYFGRFWRWTGAIFDLVGGHLVLVVYLILGVQFLKLLAPRLDSFIATIIFWVFFSVIMSLGLRRAGKAELALNLVLIGVLLFLLFLGFEKLSFADLPEIGSGGLIFLPYGVLIFALTGAIGVPELRDLLRGNEQSLKKVIIVGTLLAAIISFLFGFGIAGVTKLQTTENALIGLETLLGSIAIKTGAIVGLIAVGTSYLIGALYLRDVLMFDFNWSKLGSTILTFLLPFVLFQFGLQSLVTLVGFVGAVFVAFSFVVILFLYRAAQKKGTREPEYKLAIPAWLIWVLVVLFAGGAIIEILL